MGPLTSAGPIWFLRVGRWELRGLKELLHEGGSASPASSVGPVTFRPAWRSDFVIGAEDWYATLPRLTGLGGELPAGMDGIDITPTLLGRVSRRGRFCYREFPNRGGWQWSESATGRESGRI